MFKSAFVTVVAAMYVAGCANLQGGVSLPMPPMPRDKTEITSDQAFELLPFTRPARCGVNVYVDEDNTISIDHEPVRTKRCVGAVKKIVWKLDPGDPTLSFPSDGIVLKTTPAFGDPTCEPIAASAGKKFSCTFPDPPNGKTYFYKITVLRGSATLVLDPSMVNN